jgi:translational activator of cytochrome c oxidase 1
VTVLTRGRECLTDNGNRTLHQIREILNEHKYVNCPSSPFLSFPDPTADSARFATVNFMFRHRGRVRVALSKQDVAGGWVDRLLDEVLPAGAEDFDQVTGAGEDVEVEVRY